jgi:chromosome segregation ATPase
MEILNRKKASIESTLEDAIKSYDEISRVATQARDAQSLANIIDSKIRIIEKLSQERININEQLDRLGRQKAEQLDRLEYTYFHVYVYENKFMDAEMLKDSWKNEIKNFVAEINKIAQDSSIGLVALIFKIIQVALYLLIITITLKLGWKAAKIIWKK